MIKKFFEKDSVLKIVSVFVALLVWLYVIYIEDPEVKTTIDDVAVTYDESKLAGDLSLIEYSAEAVDVKVSGNRSDVMEIEADDISAVLDLSSIKEEGEYKNVKLEVSTANKKIEIVDSSEKEVTVKIDKVVSRKFDIQVEYDGNMPDGYIIADEPNLNLESVWVKGAKTYVENISGAYIGISCEKLSRNKTVDCKIYLRDKDGKVINKKHRAYKYLELAEEAVSAYIKVGKTTTAKVEVSGGGDFEIISVSPEEVEIYSEVGSVTKVYTKSIRNKEPDKEGYISVKLDIPDNVTAVKPSQSIKIKVEKK